MTQKLDSPESQQDIPSYLSLVYSPEQIAERIRELGEDISAWAKDVSKRTSKDVVAIAVLRGGIFFFADLVRAITTSVEVAPVKTVGYDPTTNKVISDIQVIIEGIDVHERHLLLIDDICDSGKTFERLVPELIQRGAREVKTAALVRKTMPHKTFIPDWIGFEFTGADWLVGFGMDDRERWRNLPAVYSMPPLCESSNAE